MSHLYLQVGVDNVEYRKEETGIWVCLSDIVQKIIESKKPKDYMYKIKNKRLIDKKLYISLDQTKELLEKSKKSKTRPLYAELCKLKPTKVISGVESDIEKTDDDLEEEEFKDLQHLPDICDNTESFPDQLKDTFLDIQNNYFKYKGKDVFVVTVENVAWFKGKDVANLLDFCNTAVTINQQVSKDDKVALNDLGVNFKLTPLDPQTIFINLEGVYDLIMSSRKPEAKIFRRWLSHRVLPALNKFGSYSLGKKYGSFYDNADLFEYQNQNVFYVAYIGVHRNEPLFKFGISFDYYRREFTEHKKIYETFDLLYLRRTDNNRTVEELFKKECQIKELYRKIELHGKQHTELFTINEKNSFDRMRVILDKIIEQYPTREIIEREEKIQSLQNQVNMLENVNTEKDKLIHELQKDKTWLQRIIENFKMIHIP